jgi:two-component system response regulator ChvI
MHCNHCGSPLPTLAPSRHSIGGLELVAGQRARWNGTDVGLTAGEFRVISLLAGEPGVYRSYRLVYDVMRNQVGFIAGSGIDGYQCNVRSAIKRIRSKFRRIDPGFDGIRTYSTMGYCWNADANTELTSKKG